MMFHAPISDSHPLVQLAQAREVKALSLFAKAATELDATTMNDAFQLEIAHAPHRRAEGKHYFVEHHVLGRGIRGSNREEEHFAVALCHEHRDEPVTLPGGETLRILDYQFPLKARQGDYGVGKVDLFGVTSSGVACVIEFKVAGSGYPETPLRALLEALAYAAVVQGNLSDIASEANERFGIDLEIGERPDVMVLAPERYWEFFRRNSSAGPWREAMKDLITRVELALGLRARLIELKGYEFEMGSLGAPPRITQRGAWSEAV
jgi:hypothetical protein